MCSCRRAATTPLCTTTLSAHWSSLTPPPTTRASTPARPRTRPAPTPARPNSQCTQVYCIEWRFISTTTGIRPLKVDCRPSCRAQGGCRGPGGWRQHPEEDEEANWLLWNPQGDRQVSQGFVSLDFFKTANEKKIAVRLIVWNIFKCLQFQYKRQFSENKTLLFASCLFIHARSTIAQKIHIN